MKLQKKLTKKTMDNIEGTLFALPPVLGFLLFAFVPMLLSLFLSFGELETFNMFDIKLTGPENYIRIFTEDSRFFKSVANTFLYSFASVFIGLAISLFLAVMLNVKIRLSKFFRIILFIPYVCSVVATSTMWKWLFDYNYGVLNDVMSFFGLARVDWLNNTATAMPAMIFMTVWGSLGYNIILYSAALTSVSSSYYEAAELDGASKIRSFFKITLPLISPTTFFLLVMGMIGSLQSFANFQIMTPMGGPDFSTLTMVFHVYNMAFVEDPFTYGMGYACALSWIVGLIVMVFTAINFKLSRRWVYDA